MWLQKILNPLFSRRKKKKISRSSRHNPTGKLNLLRAPQASELALYAKVLTPFWLQDDINVTFMTKTFRKLPPKSEDHGFDVEKLSYFVYTYYIVLNLRLYFGIYTVNKYR